MKKSYLSSKVEIGGSGIEGKGLFAREKIYKDELVIDFSTGPGTILKAGEEMAETLFAKGYDYMIQVGEDELFAATQNDELEDVDFLNHSCDPNCGISGALKIVAMRDVKPGEEIAFDYAMSESTDYEMDCLCG